jgi:lipopolysaccharide biosynthesis glycosyltransferase
MTIPIVFCTDKNLVIQTCVCVSSLLINAGKDELYDIYIIVDKNVDTESRNKMQSLDKCFACTITIIIFEYTLAHAYPVEYITIAMYYRLFIPELISKYDKIFYSDVDIIFRRSISSLYKETDLSNSYLAAARSIVDKKYLSSIRCSPSTYFCSGFLLLNSKKMREDKLIDHFIGLMHRKYKFPDQDILNIACKGAIAFFPTLLYGFDQTFYFKILRGENVDLISYTEEELKQALCIGLIHYTGVEKPWNYPCFRNDIWWEYYRKHPFYDEKYYFEKQMYLKNGDYFSFGKRLRLLIRYVVGKNGVLKSILSRKRWI